VKSSEKTMQAMKDALVMRSNMMILKEAYERMTGTPKEKASDLLNFARCKSDFGHISEMYISWEDAEELYSLLGEALRRIR
jgi:hypothetical protein